MTFKFWGNIANILSPAPGQVDDVFWSDGNSANASNPVWVADETAIGTYLPGAPTTYGVFLSSEDATLDQAPALLVASPTVSANTHRKATPSHAWERSRSLKTAFAVG